MGLSLTKQANSQRLKLKWNSNFPPKSRDTSSIQKSNTIKKYYVFAQKFWGGNIFFMHSINHSKKWTSFTFLKVTLPNVVIYQRNSQKVFKRRITIQRNNKKYGKNHTSTFKHICIWRIHFWTLYSLFSVSEK